MLRCLVACEVAIYDTVVNMASAVMYLRNAVQRKPAYHWQACEDCSTTGAVLKLLDSFEGLLDRPALAEDLRREHEALVTEFSADLTQASDVLKRWQSAPRSKWLRLTTHPLLISCHGSMRTHLQYRAVLGPAFARIG